VSPQSESVPRGPSVRDQDYDEHEPRRAHPDWRVAVCSLARRGSGLRIQSRMLTHDESFHEESLWFGASERPLFGRLTTPSTTTSKGGVVLSPPIGRESILARRALRSLAIYLATDGYVSLRYDHFGTGDSSGSMDEDDFDYAWVEGVDQAAAFLRSVGVTSISAVGMRMGATIVGTAASAYDLGLSSFVMWDPCESGRVYVRELDALGALRRNVVKSEFGEQTSMLEYAIGDEAVGRMNQFSLREPAARPVAKRVLVVVRDDRTLSSRFRERWSSGEVDWATTSEQGPLLETELPTSVQPVATLSKIRAWLTEPETTPTSFSTPSLPREAVLVKEPNSFSVKETALELGFRKMFALVSEPVGEAHGPLMVLINGINEDHVGPSRLWVELSRHWASLGLRCVRFDYSGLGESPWLPNQPSRPVFDKTLRQDIVNAVRIANLGKAQDSVLIGLCSGAQLALEAALELESRGVCAINPQVGAGVLRSADDLRHSDRESIRSLARSVETLLKRHQWIGELINWISRLTLMSAYSPQVTSALTRNDSNMLLLLGPDDNSPYAGIPLIGSAARRRLTSSERIDVEIVPGLDHDFLSTVGRGRAVAILDGYVVENYVDAPQ